MVARDGRPQTTSAESLAMTNKEFIRRLKKARKLALTKYKDYLRIVYACSSADLEWGVTAVFGDDVGDDDFFDNSSYWLVCHGNTDENVRAVFDNSIKALGGKP